MGNTPLWRAVFNAKGDPRIVRRLVQPMSRETSTRAATAGSRLYCGPMARCRLSIRVQRSHALNPQVWACDCFSSAFPRRHATSKEPNPVGSLVQLVAVGQQAEGDLGDKLARRFD